MEHLYPETALKCWKRCEPMHDDVLMVCVGATTGRLCLLKKPPKFVIVRSVALEDLFVIIFFLNIWP
jgi:type I restriction enzyme S subunit